MPDQGAIEAGPRGASLPGWRVTHPAVCSRAFRKPALVFLLLPIRTRLMGLGALPPSGPHLTLTTSLKAPNAAALGDYG